MPSGCTLLHGSPAWTASLAGLLLLGGCEGFPRWLGSGPRAGQPREAEALRQLDERQRRLEQRVRQLGGRQRDLARERRQPQEERRALEEDRRLRREQQRLGVPPPLPPRPPRQPEQEQTP
jgi:hypothetical protein